MKCLCMFTDTDITVQMLWCSDNNVSEINLEV